MSKKCLVSQLINIYLVPPADAPSFDPRLLTEFRAGNPEAAGKLVECFYPELRRLAFSRMLGERLNHTWQPTVLVHELYLELIRVKALAPGSDDDDEEEEKKAFFGLAAFLMRRLLVHYARPLPKRVTKTGISEALGVGTSGEQSLLEVEDLLRPGRDSIPRCARWWMKVFEGMSQEEIAERLGCSIRSVARHWEFAPHWLRDAITSNLRQNLSFRIANRTEPRRSSSDNNCAPPEATERAKQACGKGGEGSPQFARLSIAGCDASPTTGEYDRA